MALLSAVAARSSSLVPVTRTSLAAASREVAVQAAAFVLSLGVLIGLLALLGYDPGSIVRALWSGSAGSTVSLGISLSDAVPLMLTGVAVWLAAQGGLFNIGGDGQLQVGALAALVVASEAGLPDTGILLVPLALLAAALAGGAWASIAGAMRTLRGANEIISTLMLNFVAFITIDEVMRGPLQSKDNPYTPQTDPVPGSAQLSSLVSGTQLTWGFIVALVVAVAVIALVRTSTAGLRLQAVGLNRDAARHAGLPIRRYWFGSMAASGVLCGFAGGLVLLGLRYYLAPGWADPWGYQGILIAFLAMRSPLLIPLWGILFGMLAAAGPVLKGDASVPDSVVTVMQTLPVITLFLLTFAFRWIGARRAEVAA
ncbi:MAG TPA: ABC transporter permease [Gaiellaceae bacterium]|nr:ABC transporter permease [Gaiellaceae bacterium]